MVVKTVVLEGRGVPRVVVASVVRTVRAVKVALVVLPVLVGVVVVVVAVDIVVVAVVVVMVAVVAAGPVFDEPGVVVAPLDAVVGVVVVVVVVVVNVVVDPGGGGVAVADGGVIRIPPTVRLVCENAVLKVCAAVAELRVTTTTTVGGLLAVRAYTNATMLDGDKPTWRSNIVVVSC